MKASYESELWALDSSLWGSTEESRLTLSVFPSVKAMLTARVAANALSLPSSVGSCFGTSAPLPVRSLDKGPSTKVSNIKKMRTAKAVPTPISVSVRASPVSKFVMI